MLAQVSTNTSLFVVLAPSTGDTNTSFAEISVVVFTDGTGAAAELSSAGTVRVSDQGNRLGISKLLPVNGSSLPGACAGMFCTAPSIKLTEQSPLKAAAVQSAAICFHLISISDAGFLLVTLSAGDHNLSATFEGNGDFSSSTSIPFIVTAGQVCHPKVRY